MYLEGRKLRLEERKLELERARFEHENRGLKFINSNFGIIITAMIGVATVTVSFVQLQISYESSRAQLELQKAISDAQIELEIKKTQATKEKEERAFQFDVARLLLEKQKEIDTQEVRGIYYMRDVVISTLPTEVGARITRKMADMAPSEQLRTAWADGYVQLRLTLQAAHSASGKPPPATEAITIDHVVKNFPRLNEPKRRDRLADLLEAAKAAGLTPDVTAILLAVAFWNTLDLEKLEEPLLTDNTADQLRGLFPAIFKSAADADEVRRDPRALANKLYGGSLGNMGPEDNWTYRGRGYFMTNGKRPYETSGRMIGIALEKQPDDLLDSKIAAREAVALIRQLPQPTLATVLRLSQGSLLGLAQIQGNYEKILPTAPKVTEGLSIQSERGPLAASDRKE